MNSSSYALIVIVLFAVIASCIPSIAVAEPGTDAVALDAAFQVTSSAFRNNGNIPAKFGYYGEDCSPQFSWKNAPSGVKSFALVMTDMDYMDQCHWLIYDIKPSLVSLQEKIPIGSSSGGSYRQGVNGYGVRGYRGPFPPAGVTHRYRFRLYALNVMIKKSGLNLASFEAKLQGHVIKQTEILGKFKG